MCVLVGTEGFCADGAVLHVVWQDLRDGESAIWYNRSEDGGSNWLTSDVRLDDDVGVATAPDVSCGDGRVYAVWVDDGRDTESALAGVQLRASGMAKPGLRDGAPAILAQRLYARAL